MALKTNFPLETYLSILQQVEYDLSWWWRWVRQPRQDTHVVTHLQQLTPEKYTAKLRLIAHLSRHMAWIWGPVWAIYLTTLILSPLELLTKKALLWQARRRLRYWQKKGLVVIAVAGSYGKTSLKNSLAHLLGTQAYTHLTPASFNTPLGIAQTINGLNGRHRYCIMELGEYVPGDIDQLLRLTRPDIGVLTPIGHAHLERFGSMQALQDTFAEMLNSPAAPPLLLINDQNRAHFNTTQNNHAQRVVWYGKDKSSDITVSSFNTAWTSSSVEVTLAHQKMSTTTPLLSAAQTVNCLPGLWLLHERHHALSTGIVALQYHPPIHRRYEAHHNPNGTLVIDNSYNTNPATWNESRQIIDELKPDKLAVITAGFVEMDESSTLTAHAQLANDLATRTILIGIIRTRYNADLIAALEGRNTNMVVGSSYHEVLHLVSQPPTTWRVLWLEGGAREMYL